MSSRLSEERVYRDRQAGGRGIAGSSEVILREPEAWCTEAAAHPPVAAEG